MEELNGFTTNEDFEVEIYRIEMVYTKKTIPVLVDGEVVLQETEVSSENLIPLSFPKENQGFEITENNILKVKRVPRTVSEVNLNASMVEYFFDVAIDREVDSNILCTYKPLDKRKGIFSPRYYECADEQQEKQRVDIYSESEYEDICE